MLGGQMVVFGGDRGGDYLADVWSYSLADDAWTRLQARHEMLAAVRCLACGAALLRIQWSPTNKTCTWW